MTLSEHPVIAHCSSLLLSFSNFFLIADAWQQRNQRNVGLHVHKSCPILGVRRQPWHSWAAHCKWTSAQQPHICRT